MNEPVSSESRVELPPAATDSFEVYVNGVLQQRDIDYRLDGRTLVFPRVLTPEIKMSKRQWILTLLGIAGTYAKHDHIDVAYRADGRKLVATGLRPLTGESRGAASRDPTEGLLPGS